MEWQSTRREDYYVGVEERVLAESNYLRWWDEQWILTEYFWPMIESKAVNSYEQWLKTPWVDILRLKRTYGTYNQLKNYDTFYDLEIKSNDGEDKKDYRTPKKKDYLWSKWGINSAMEYDMMIVPQLGDEGWRKMMGFGGVAACNRRQ